MPKTYTTEVMEVEGILILCKKYCCSDWYRTSSGGFNNPNKVVEYRAAFVSSLRKYERPNSAYTKLGGMNSGMKRTPSASTLG